MSESVTAADTLHPRCPIMIVDDEEPILLAIDTTLRMAGISNIITCADSRRVLGLLSEKLIELILLDLNMPHVHGERLLDTVSRDFPDSSWPTTAVSRSDGISADPKTGKHFS